MSACAHQRRAVHPAAWPQVGRGGKLGDHEGGVAFSEMTVEDLLEVGRAAAGRLCGPSLPRDMCPGRCSCTPRAAAAVPTCLPVLSPAA